MKVIDLIITLQQLDPNLEIMLDATTEGMETFKFVEIEFVDEVETSLGEHMAVISPYDLNAQDEEESGPDFSLN